MLTEYILFFAKIFTLLVAILLLFTGTVWIANKGKLKSREKLEIKNVNDKLSEVEKLMRMKVLNKPALKTYLKTLKETQKQKKKDSTEETTRKRIFLINFLGDIRATAVKNLREEITSILTIATPEDEVVLRLESAGGMVHAYGLAASQLQRIRHRKIPLTVIIDKVAASGGYMMAAVGDRILAAPFAVVGSIGVIAQLPNFNRLLKKNDIDFEQITAGQYKRTLTLLGENTKQGRDKFQEEVNETHRLFKLFISENRPIVNIEEVATGEHWYGTDAIKLKLVDEIQTSDDYLLAATQKDEVYEVCYSCKKTWMEKIAVNAQKGRDYLLQGLRGRG